jgi:hypothetical protein
LRLSGCVGRRLTIYLGFQLIDRFLLGLYFPLKGCDLLTLRFDERRQAAGVGLARIAGTFPRPLRINRVCGPGD